MKIFFTLLTMLLLSLPSMACDSNEVCCEETEPTSAVIAASHPEHSEEQGCCDSLCDCSCCAIPVILAEAAKLPAQKTTFVKKAYHNFNTASGNEVYYPVWQPPKI